MNYEYIRILVDIAKTWFIIVRKITSSYRPLINVKYSAFILYGDIMAPEE